MAKGLRTPDNFNDKARELVDLFLRTGDGNPLLTHLTPWTMTYMRHRFHASEDDIGDTLLKISEKIDYLCRAWDQRREVPFSFWFATVLRNSFYDIRRKDKEDRARSGLLAHENLVVDERQFSNQKMKEKLANLNWEALSREESLLIKIMFDLDLSGPDVLGIKETCLRRGPKGQELFSRWQQVMGENRIRARERQLKLKSRLERLEARSLAPVIREEKRESIRKKLLRDRPLVPIRMLAGLFAVSPRKIMRLRDQALKKLGDRNGNPAPAPAGEQTRGQEV